MKQKNNNIFYALLREYNLPIPVEEYQFNPNRKWRFDYAWIGDMVALEIEGGIFTYGRHNRATGFIKDIEKYNTATIMGWRILRTTPDKLCTYEYCIFYLEQLIKKKKGR